MKQFLVLVAACGSSSAEPDAAKQLDAKSVDATVVDAAPVVDASTCLVASPLTATKAIASTEKTDADANPPVDALFYEGFYTDDVKPDGFYLFLFSGGGPFTDGLAPMTIDFAAMPDEQQGDTCSACIVLEGDVDRDTNTETVDYLPKSGTLTISSLKDRYTATLTNAVFRQVDMPQGGSTPDDPSGCTVTVPSYTFDTPIIVETTVDAGSGPVAKGRHVRGAPRAKQRR